MRRNLLALLLFSLYACKPSEENRMKAIVGAVLMDGEGGPPITDSVVVVAGGRIGAAGPRTSVAIPPESDKIDGSGQFIVPALIDLFAREDPATAFTSGHPATADQGRARVAGLAAARAEAVHIWKMDPAVAEPVLEAARNAGIRIVGHISTEAEAKFMVDNGAAALVGTMLDTENLDPAFLERLRDLRIVYAPALSSAGPQLETAKRNARRLFAGGVPLAVASCGGDFIREAELMAGAGVPPLDVIVAATRNPAMALRRLDYEGTIQPGKRADLLVLSANPGEDIRNLRRVRHRMAAGSWTR